MTSAADGQLQSIWIYIKIHYLISESFQVGHIEALADQNFTLSKKIRLMSLPPREQSAESVHNFVRSLQELEHWGGKLYRTRISKSLVIPIELVGVS